jgi:hypothetical protein
MERREEIGTGPGIPDAGLEGAGHVDTLEPHGRG